MRSRLAFAALALTFATASLPRPALALGPSEDPSALIGEGDALHSEGKYAEAAKAYAAAYQTMQPDEQASPLGELVVSNAAKEYQQAFLESGDIALLEASRDVLRAFVDDRTEGAGAVAGPILKELRRVEGVIANLRKSTGSADAEPEEPTTVPTTEEADDTDITSRTATESTPRDQPRRVDAVGLGLTISGAALVVAGAALLGVGATTGPAAEAQREDALASDAYMMASAADQMAFRSAYDGWVDDEKTRGIAFMAAGGAGLGVGVGLVIAGAIRLARGKDTAAAAVTPAFGPRRAGLVLTGRF